MPDLKFDLSGTKKLFFASDLHLGLSAISRKDEIARERVIIDWLDSIRAQAEAIFLVGDIFDFWYEYKHAVPKGFVRFLGKIATLMDQGTPVYFFTGNHDLWMYSYFQEELGVNVYTKPIELHINSKSMLLAHGDGLGPGDGFYKILKKIFTFRVSQWLFTWLHPDVGISLAKRWSKSSRIKKLGTSEEFLGEKEFLIQYSRAIESKKHHDFYVYGHRHHPVEVDLNENSKYINLGEWVYDYTYAVFDGKKLELKRFAPGS